MPTNYDVNNVATTNAATSQSDFTWWTRAPYYSDYMKYVPDNRQYTAVYEREREPETEDFDITELEKYIDSLKKEVVETES